MAVRILVVDSDPTVQRALGATLSQAGYEVVPTADPAEGLRIAHSDKPALVLVAANLAGIDGFTMVSRLRVEDGPSTHTPVILLLPENEPEGRGKALRAGADDYLIKPFHPAELMARMRSLLARYQPDEKFVAPNRPNLIPAASSMAPTASAAVGR